MFKDGVVFGVCICLFAYRTFVASGMQSIVVPMMLNKIGRRKKQRFIKAASQYKCQESNEPIGLNQLLPVDAVPLPQLPPVQYGFPEKVPTQLPPATIKDAPPQLPAPVQDASVPESEPPLLLPPVDAFPENQRLFGGPSAWKKWGPYLADRQWSTVREDYSYDGSCWEYFPHDDARARVYRWGEDGLLGLTDDKCQLCFSLSFWNGKDPILKERLFGYTGNEGNHGESCKECVYYIDSTPTHSYMKALYKYPQAEYPYSRLVEDCKRRSVLEPEYELRDTGVFDDNRYWDIVAEYAKETPNEILMRITIKNRGSDVSTLQFIPQLWYRNTWRWNAQQVQPRMEQVKANHVFGANAESGVCSFFVGRDPNGSLPNFLFTNNETNMEKIHGSSSHSQYVRDAFHRYIINGETDAVNPDKQGTKFGAQYVLEVPANGQVTLKLKLCASSNISSDTKDFGRSFDEIFAHRINEANGYYNAIIPGRFSKEEKVVARQGYAGVLWNKQFYEFDVGKWLKSVPEPKPGSRRSNFMETWPSLFFSGVFSVTDKWEYPWISNWDMAFNLVPLAQVDHRLAMQQLEIMLRRENIGPDGEIPACEFNFSDIYPPVTAWCVWQVYHVASSKGDKNVNYLKMAFQALTFHFKQWLSKKNSEGKTILLSGGCFQMDNLGFFDCSREYGGIKVATSDQCMWSMFYCKNLIKIAFELAQDDALYEEIATRLCQTYLQLLGTLKKLKMWSESDGFYYNILRGNKQSFPIRVRSIFSFVPLLGCLVLEDRLLKSIPQFQEMVKAEQMKKSQLKEQVSFLGEAKRGQLHHLMSVPTAEQLKDVLRFMLHEEEFLSPYGIRSLSKYHQENPYTITIKDEATIVQYMPGEGRDNLFGGNNNWRGPVWINVNYLIIQSLEEYYTYYQDELKVECPTGSGNCMNLLEVSQELSSRVAKVLLPNEDGRRPCHGNDPLYQSDANWKDLLLFHECFNGDTGKGCGASHATGWTSLVINCMGKNVH